MTEKFNSHQRTKFFRTPCSCNSGLSSRKLPKLKSRLGIYIDSVRIKLTKIKIISCVLASYIRANALEEYNLKTTSSKSKQSEVLDRFTYTYIAK